MGCAKSSQLRGQRRRRAPLWLLVAFALSVPLVQAADRIFYRYTNERGVKVLNHSIPPEYAQLGYEVISASGHVMRKVPPALSGVEAQRQEEQQRQAQERKKRDSQLRRRYSSVADIESAKSRKLAELDNNIAVQHGNIKNLSGQIEDLQTRAAKIERSGLVVPDNIVNAVLSLQVERQGVEAQVQLREKEYNEVVARFDSDMERFRLINGG